MRKSIGLKLRFEVFKRDGFCCRYCGSTPPTVVLEIDHIVPVADGGTNDQENLATSCFECNRGKRDNPLSATLRPAQFDQAREKERIKQARAYTEHLIARQKVQGELFDVISDHWVRVRGENPDEVRVAGKTADAIRRFIKVLPASEIIDAIDIAQSKMGHRAEYSMMKYFFGVCWKKIRDRQA